MGLVAGSEPSSKPLRPVVVRVLRLNTMTEEQVNESIAEFYETWQETHRVLPFSYNIGPDGQERIFIQAMVFDMWLQNGADNGVLQAQAQVAGQAFLKAAQGGVQVAQAAPAGPAGLRGAFPGR